MLSCRNLLIYLNQDVQDRVIPIFHFSLRSEGILFLGSSENVTRHPKLFAPVDRKSRVFRRLETATRIIPDFPLSQRVRGSGNLSAAPPSVSLDGRLPASVNRQAEAVAERYAPAYVVVDTQGDILHFSGRTGRYLEPSPGAASLSLPNLVHRDLRLDVRSALQRAIAESRRVELPRLTVRQDDHAFDVTIVVEPLARGDVTSLVVLFQDLGVTLDNLSGADRLTSDEHVQRLEMELRITRDRLQATIEELESTNEELKSSNEEYQSINEELQSANEEMETSKEELQSVNEELHTVNGELAHRVQELGRANSDLKNLLESTQIATVFLDNDLRIRSFTPAATDVFHLLDTDVGRPLDHVVSRVSYPELIDDVRRVLKTLTTIERQVSDVADRHFAVRVLPYRSVDNYISGAVVTFTDLTAVRQVEAALRESEALRRVALAGGRMGAWRWDLNAALIWGDAQFWMLWGYPPSDDPRPLSDLNQRMSQKSAEDVAALVASAIEVGERFDGPLEIVAGPNAGHWLRWQGRAGDDPSLLVGVLFDITEQKRSEESLRESEERQAFLLNLADVLRPLAEIGEVERHATLLLGEQIKADRCFLSTVDEDGLGICVREEYLRSGASSMLGDYTFAQLGSLVGSELRAGRVLAVEDVDALAGLSPVERANYAAVGIAAYLLIPLIRNGRLAAILAINHRTPRAWSEADKAVALQTADRLWTARERARVEAALRDGEQRQRALVEGIPQLVWRAGKAGDWTWASPQWSTYTGQLEPASRGMGWLDAIHPDDRDDARAAWAEADEENGIDVEYRIRCAADDSYRWFRARATPVRDGHGALVEWLGTSTDIDEARALQKRQELLVAELQHRVRNMLTVVRSVFAQTVETGTDVAEIADHFRGRLDALARTQVIVTRSAEGTADLENLVRDELLSVGVSDGPKLRISGPDVTLTSKTTESIGLALHELTTNALKYGALKVPNATLDISWAIDVGKGNVRRLDLVWIEQGVPAVPTRPARAGFGRELIEEALPYRLGAETKLEFKGGGVRCTISVPLAEEAAADAEPWRR